ncbi:MAG TPA: glycosyltransferase family 2 protein [Chitinophagaceae bacterium]|nr:glycosyltransferase family 2 protein [Chitinophagaceae bacterium]
MLQLIGYIIFTALFVYLAAGVLYLFVLAVAGLLRKKKQYVPAGHKNRIAILVPAYKEDAVILDTARQATLHNYPADRFEVFVIADKLKEETIAKLQSIPVQVIKVQFETSTKARSLHLAMQQLAGKGYDHAMILDADNIMGAGCLEQVNAAMANGAGAVQCHRTAKNKQTAIAVLDAISEEINNHLFRKGPAAFGVSAALIGSGMAFRFQDLQSILNLPHILDNPGEDREIDLQLMHKNIRVQYLDDALVYDEKVASAQVFEKQRVRWLEAQVMHFRRFLQADMRSAPRNSNYWNKFAQTLLLPRSLYILVLAFMLALAALEWIFSWDFLYPPAAWWAGMAMMFAITLLFAIPACLYNARTFKAVLHVPVLIFTMVKALLQVKKNRTQFLHTPKNYTSG